MREDVVRLERPRAVKLASSRVCPKTAGGGVYEKVRVSYEVSVEHLSWNNGSLASASMLLK